MPPKVGESVAVITGASSGIARATAVAFAERGARLVLAARSERSLDEVVRECEAAGGRAIAVPTDVGNETAVQRLAARAHEEFGRLDIWVNAAAVMTYGQSRTRPPKCSGESSTPTRWDRSTVPVPHCPISDGVGTAS